MTGRPSPALRSIWPGDQLSLDRAIAYSDRFRTVSTRYPRRVGEAYGEDLARAMADDDATVAATVAAWEQANGLPVRDWGSIGRQERGEEPSA